MSEPKPREPSSRSTAMLVTLALLLIVGGVFLVLFSFRREFSTPMFLGVFFGIYIVVIGFEILYNVLKKKP